MAHDTTKLAVLIDADNARPAIVEGLLAEIAKYGTAHVKRIYGDWTKPDLNGWKEVLLRHSIQPIQQFRYTVGKNATDSAMIIDAMDLLYAERFDGFCIVSSDSDFTRLASRIRESGRIVYGFGERKTPEPFRTACDKFIYTEVLAGTTATEAEAAPKQRSAKELRGDTRLVNLLRGAIEAASDDTGWASLGTIGSIISKQVARLRFAQLRLRQAQRPDQGHRPVRHRGTPDRQRQAHLRAPSRPEQMSSPHERRAASASACRARRGAAGTAMRRLQRRPGFHRPAACAGPAAAGARAWPARACTSITACMPTAPHGRNTAATSAPHWTCRAKCCACRCSASSGSGLEAAARDARYAALAAQLHEGEWLLLGHHRDDQVETVLLKLLRGAGPEGLGGMRSQRPFGRGQLWRPVLELSRQQLRDYVDTHQLECIDDPSNGDIATGAQPLASRNPAATAPATGHRRGIRSCTAPHSVARLPMHCKRIGWLHSPPCTTRPAAASTLPAGWPWHRPCANHCWITGCTRAACPRPPPRNADRSNASAAHAPASCRASAGPVPSCTSGRRGCGRCRPRPSSPLTGRSAGRANRWHCPMVASCR